MKKGHLSYTIFFVIMAVALLPMILFSFYITDMNRGVLRSTLIEKLNNDNATLSEEIDVFISKNKVLVETFLKVHSIHDGKDISQNHTDVNVFIDKVPYLTGLAFLNQSALETAYFGARPRMDYSEILPSIRRTTLEDKEVLIGSIRKNPVRRQLFLKMAFPVEESAGTSALVAEFNMQPLGEALSSKDPNDILVLVFTRSGFLIYSSTEGLSTIISDTYRDKILSLSAQAPPEGGVSLIMDKDEYFGILSANSSTDWLVYTEQQSSVLQSVILDSFKSSLRTFIYAFLAVLVLSILVSLYFSNIIVRPIKVMTRAVQLVEEGEVNDLPPLPIPDNEIGAFSISFARMLDSIKLKIDAMSQDRQDLEELNQSLELRVGSRTKELRTALNELIKKERLAAIGQMASIVSHEIKNPLAVMANSVYLIKARLGEEADPRLLKNISIIEQEIKQANGIIEEILGYARSREQILTVMDLSLYMREILSSYPIPANVKVSTEYEPGQLPVKIDTEEMKQAIRNIIGNGIEVMPQGGQLIVKTKKDGANAIVSIRDTGPGIPKEIQEKIFAPFFTTKARGTGLGLAVVKKVSARNNADILLQSEEGKGTKISVIFKIHKEEEVS